MADLGAFDAAVRELDPDRERDSFTFCGERFTVEGEIPAVCMLQLGAAATGKIEETEGLAAMWEALRGSLGDDGFDRLYRTAVAKHADLDVLMRLTFKLFEVQGGRPTEQAPASSDGPPGTSPSSSSPSTHPALSHLRPVSEVLTG